MVVGGLSSKNRIDILLHISKEFASIDNQTELFDRVVILCKEIFEADNVTIRLTQAASSKLFPVRVSELPGAAEFSRGESQAEEVFRTRQSMSLDNLESFPGYSSLSDSIRCALIAPVISRDECTGTLAIEKDRPFFFKKDDLEILEALASQLGLKIREVRSIENLKEAKKETDEILGTIDEGLFLMNKTGKDEYTISGQYSEKLKTILEHDSPETLQILEFLRSCLAKKDSEGLDAFFRLLFNPSVDEDNLEKINPLKNVQFRRRAGEDLKYLGFEFKRISSGNEQISVMVRVKDLSREFELAQALRLSEEKTESQIKKLFSILHVEPALLRQFLSECRNDLTGITEVLARDEENLAPEYLALKAVEIFRIIHGMKGNSNVLNLSFFEADLHQFEDLLQSLLEREQISGMDFLSVATWVSRIREDLTEMDTLVHRIIDFQSEFADGDDSSRLIVRSFEKTAEQAAASAGKKVELDVSHLDARILPEDMTVIIKTIGVQLIRNAIVHGIEEPSERVKKGKPEAGQIKVAARKLSGHVEFTVSDDGKGIRTDRIKQILEENKSRYFPGSSVDVEELEPARLARYIFQPGFSTTDRTDLYSGRGMGMDLIARKVKLHGGRLSLKFREGEYCSFKIIFPGNQTEGGEL